MNEEDGMYEIVHPFSMRDITNVENKRYFLNVNKMFEKLLWILLTYMNSCSYNKSIKYMNSCSYVQLKR